MNQRAIDLYKEACEFAYNVCQEQGRTGGASDHIWNTLSTGRFAELIVRECALVVYKKIGPKSALDVLEHFGVEE